MQSSSRRSDEYALPTLMEKLEDKHLPAEKFDALVESIKLSFDLINQFVKLAIGGFSATLLLLIAVLTQVLGKVSGQMLDRVWYYGIGLLGVSSIGLFASFLQYIYVNAQLESLGFLRVAKVMEDDILYERTATDLRKTGFGRIFFVIEGLCAVAATMFYVIIVINVIWTIK
jgi:uncharacterized membrane protein YuzA (DUF378 family)